MTNEDNRPEKTLRQQAEKILSERTVQSLENMESVLPEDARRLVHDLQVHQIELKIQNEELQKTQVELATEKERYFDLYDLAPVGYFTISREGVILAANLTAVTMLGVERWTLLKKHLSRFILKQDQDIYYLHFKQLTDTGEPQVCELRMLREDKPECWMRLQAIQAEEPDGSAVYRVAMSDITPQKQAEENLQLAQVQLQTAHDELEKKIEQRTIELQETQKQFLHAEKLAAVGKLSASIAHEFNNPLQGILSILKGLKKRAILEKEDKELLNAAISEGNRIKELIRSLQDFNRPSSGEKVLLDVHQSLDAVLILQKSVFYNKGITVVCNYMENLPQIIAVGDQIKQVFLNLLTNAADACNHHGCVITISTWQEGSNVAVGIKDTGIGIKIEEIEHIFRPFYTTKAEVKGTGLGLSVSHGIIQSHQGEIQVESRPGEGATFTVLLPINGGEKEDSVTDR